MTDEMLDAWDRLNMVACRVQVTQAADLTAALLELEDARKQFEALVKGQFKKR
ncbi:hypothetical protein [Pseudomonas aeruginosa]|uniref:hypothetical protein n=1 Tax=Pseudomonas aeruginosa TaxID=287 RepID=UPI0014049436|nr:hypothetical protein [Pseudomonas aeruginosa]MCV6454907.1 hypothetical protein [Pseudomonas aeruginosa]HCF0591759.1 hypothetical protein [Pseudomonas aeruginosa]